MTLFGIYQVADVWICHLYLMKIDIYPYEIGSGFHIFVVFLTNELFECFLKDTFIQGEVVKR